MVIQEEDFRLTPINESSNRFDLELLYTIQPKGKEARQEFKVVAYGISINSAMKRIAHFRMCQGLKDQALTMLDYLNGFKSELHKLSKFYDLE